MNSIYIDPELCTDCGLCIELCPTSIIFTGPEGGKPYVPDEAGAYCAKCGHCEAFCPTGAISPLFETEYFEVKESTLPDIKPEQLGNYMAQRRSIRSYRDETVDKDTIEQIFDIVRYAPSGMNRQPIHWTIIHDPDEVRKITSLSIDWMREIVGSDISHPIKPLMPSLISVYEAGGDPICRSAPHLAIAHAMPDNPSAYTDSIIALSWFELAAPAFGLGTCWGGFLTLAATSYQPLIDELDLPQGHVVQYAMMFGHPKHRALRVPGREPARINWK